MRQFHGNRVLQHLGCQFPVIQAPMGWIARSRLVSAVSEQGGFGVMETSTGGLEGLKREFDLARSLTDKPFGFNLAIKFLKADSEREQQVLRWALDGRVKVVTTSAGDPGKYVRQIKDAGVIVYHSVATLQGALKAVDAGVDGLVVEGNESGGVRGNEPVHSMVLLQAIRERVDVPIIAAGGIVDGRGMAAAFALGAEAVAMGTRFVASEESPVHAGYKNAIIDAPANATTTVHPGGRAMWRVLKTELTTRLAAGEGDVALSAEQLIDDLYVNGRIENALASSGESAALIHEVKPVRKIIEDTVDGFWREIDRLAGMRGAA